MAENVEPVLDTGRESAKLKDRVLELERVVKELVTAFKRVEHAVDETYMAEGVYYGTKFE